MLQRMLNDAPTDVSNIVYRMKHEMSLSEALNELLYMDWTIREIELAFQAHARDGLILVEQLTGGRVGQRITILSRNLGEPSHEIGQNWPTYNREQMQRFHTWSDYAGVTGWKNEDWSYHYGTWKKDLGNGYSQIRLMIADIPPLIEFESFERRVMEGQFEHFPDFMPIEVIIPSNFVISVDIPLDQHQLAVKYNFEEDMVFARAKVEEIGHATTSKERNQAVTDLIEFLIIKPTMLIHSYKLRDSIYKKLDEFMEWAKTCNDIKYSSYIHDLVVRMTAVLSMVLEDPLCVKCTF
jgi:hypothetical protein